MRSCFMHIITVFWPTVKINISIDWSGCNYVQPSREDCAVFVLHTLGGPVTENSSVWVNDKMWKCSCSYSYILDEMNPIYSCLYRIRLSVLWKYLNLFSLFQFSAGYLYCILYLKCDLNKRHYVRHVTSCQTFTIDTSPIFVMPTIFEHASKENVREMSLTKHPLTHS